MLPRPNQENERYPVSLNLAIEALRAERPSVRASAVPRLNADSSQLTQQRCMWKPVLRWCLPVVAWLWTALILASVTSADDGTPGRNFDEADAERLRLIGRYEEAIESYHTLPKSPSRSLGLARCYRQQGDLERAIQILRGSLQEDEVGKDPKVSRIASQQASSDVSILAELAKLYWESAQSNRAEAYAKRAMASERLHPLATHIQIEVLRSRGAREAAADLVAELAAEDPSIRSPEEAMWIGWAKAINGRWQKDTQVFDELVNRFYPRLLQRQPQLWMAHVAMGRLFQEKYNRPEALRALQTALAINPHAAEIHLGLGRLALANFEFDDARDALQRAREKNNQLPEVHHALADLACQNQLISEALEHLSRAEQQRPHDEQTLGRKWALWKRLDGIGGESERARQLFDAVKGRNPRCGRFHSAAAEAFQALRIYPQARDCLQRALDRSPEMIPEHGELGLLHMRLGDELAARKTLEEAFRVDPFNVRVKNTLEVLDLLERYAVLETEHFVIRFDRGQDGLLAEYAAEYLEETVYPEIVASLGYAPPEKTLLEIFSSAAGTSGHGWFSARMVGLPFIGTVGACAGKMFALTSPADGQPFHWARVLRHEFVHVVNLQQTNFQIPHWFTEALAMRNEGIRYPADWEQTLVKYMANDDLMDLSNINHGFTNPGSQERWTLAYFQAYLYADYIAELGGPRAIPQLLHCYAEGKMTADALQHVVNKSLVDFESGYRDYLKQRSRAWLQGVTPATEMSWERRLEQDGNDIEALGRLARRRCQAGDLRKARQYAERALAIDAAHPAALGVMADVFYQVGEDQRATEYADRSLAAESPDLDFVWSMANRALRDKQVERAKRLFQLGQKKDAQDLRWKRGLARVYLSQGNDRNLMLVLAQIADRSPDQVTMARKLAQLALRLQDAAAAEKWAKRVIHVDVQDALAHAQLAQAYELQGKNKRAIREYETAIQISPGEVKWKRALNRLRQ